MRCCRAGLKLILFASVVLLLGLTPDPRPFTLAMHQAEDHRLAREYAAALDAYRQAAGLDAASPLPWLGLGQIYLRQHRFVQAMAAFAEAERREGGEEAVLGLADSYAGRGDWAAAIGHWLRAQSLAPHDARVYVALGRAAIAQGQFDRARSHLTRALQLEPSAEEAAAAHSLLGRLEIADDPALAESHFRQAGDEDMLSVLAAVDGEADPVRLALLLGIAALQRNELSLARHHFERATALSPGDAEAWAYLAHTLDQQGETLAAGELLAQALALDGESPLIHYFLGTHHRLVGNLDDAQSALWQALLRDPENAAFRAELAGTFVDQSDYPRAEEWYVGAVKVAPTDVNFRLMLVRFHLDHLYRVAEGGVPAAEALVGLAPGDARAYDLLGWVYLLAGRRVEGQRALLRALALEPDLVSANYHLGSLYFNAGQHDLARQYLQRASDLDQQGFYRPRADLLLQGLETGSN
jgi:tetratricopeptide (TPR) repeat protein